MALTADRNTPARTGDLVQHPVDAATQIFAGSILCINDAGFAVPATTTTTGRVVGRANTHADNRVGSEGDVFVSAERGVFRFLNSAGDLVTRADIGSVAFVVDDETVARTDGSESRIPAGVIVDVDDDGVWVALGLFAIDVTVESAPDGLLEAAQNLADVADPAEARAQIGADVVTMSVPIGDLADDGDHYSVAPVEGRIVAAHLVVGSSPSDGDASVSVHLADSGSPVTVLTVAQGAPAKSIDTQQVAGLDGSCTPGDLITLTAAGGLDAACPGHVVLVLRTGPVID